MSSLDPLVTVLKGALSFIIVLPILIAVHELGHFWVARLFGMKVDAFAVMMGGVRKTRLDGLLTKPLVPAGNVWTFGMLSFAALVMGVLLKSVPTVYAGLVLVGIVLPVWVVSRLGALYHLRPMSALGTLVKTWGVAILLSLFATKLQGLDPMQLLGLITLASFVATLIVYYYPVFRKPEEAPHGYGQIEISKKLMGRESKAQQFQNVDESAYAEGVRRFPVYFRPLWSVRDKQGTEFSLLCLPLGGFAAIKGMHPKEDGSETKIPGGFYSKSPFARFCVLLAGPMFSIIFGVLILAAGYAISGRQEPNPEPVIGIMDSTTPAAQAGLKQGDRFLSVNGQPVAKFFDVVKIVRESHSTVNGKEVPKPVHVVVERSQQQLKFDVLPLIDPTPSPVLGIDLHPTTETAIQAKLGIRPVYVSVPMPLSEAFAEAAVKPAELVTGLAQTFSKPAKIAENVGGPAAIAEQMTQASAIGIEAVIGLAGLLSISLGVMNLLPIVPFDGGQIVVALAEMLRGGKRLSMQLQTRLSTVGMFLIFVLITFVLTIDIGRHAPK